MRVYVATAQCPVCEPDSCVVLRMDEQAVTILALDQTRQVIPAAQFHHWYEPYRGRPFTVDAHGTVVYQEPPVNVAQALAQLFPTLVPARDIHEARPTPLPTGAFWVISEITDAARRDYYPEANGARPQERTLTLLITLYGKEGWTLSDLRPIWQAARAGLANLVTEHPGYPPLRGVTRGAVLPPTPDSDTRRPLAAVRLICVYIE